jgi:hypothetical protein
VGNLMGGTTQAMAMVWPGEVGDRDNMVRRG